MGETAGVFSVRSQCLGKRGYRTKADAKGAKRRTLLSGTGGGLMIYRCPWCELWHLGHKPAAVKAGDTLTVTIETYWRSDEG